ncbi:hypothetical protein IEQ34_014459 [Dendrobium chrysotoxum]|uniref:Uncharacterized protein n=1 Tax=Dendrobium chrysotoxum TaxID=161865 RepID=A0AAV7GJY0_DENCH|nr:hypothetical protein IEQ34_014459 [Dendrobium chrysotoxum]
MEEIGGVGERSDRRRRGAEEEEAGEERGGHAVVVEGGSKNLGMDLVELTKAATLIDETNE